MTTERKATRLQALVLLNAAALTIALSLSAGTMAAQAKPIVVKAEAELPEGARARADWYAARAEAFDLGSSRDGYVELARLYRTSANLRGADTAAVTSYRLAAWAYVASGDKIAALRVMTRAAELAEQLDQVERAAGTYMDAALIAYSGGRQRDVATLTRQANDLIESQRLSADRRVALRNRMESEPVLAAAMR